MQSPKLRASVVGAGNDSTQIACFTSLKSEDERGQSKRRGVERVAGSEEETD